MELGARLASWSWEHHDSDHKSTQFHLWTMGVAPSAALHMLL